MHSFLRDTLPPMARRNSPGAFVFRHALAGVAWTARTLWTHRREIAAGARQVGQVAVAAGDLAGRALRPVIENRREIGQVALGACHGGATAVAHAAAPFTTRRRIERECAAVRRQVNAYKRLTDRRFQVLAKARAKRETLLDALLVGGHSLASYGSSVAVPAQIRRAYELAYPNLAASHGFTEQVRSLNADQLTGFAAGVKGKLFELKLLEQMNGGGLPEGYQAALAKSASQPGYDLMVFGPDGKVSEVLQAKAADSVSYVQQALERYPHIDVISTQEVASHMALLGLGERVTDSGIPDAALEELVSTSIESQALQMHYMPSLLVLGLIAYTTFKGGRSLHEQGRVFGERSTKSYMAYLAGGGAAVATQLWWMAIPIAVGARLLMGSGERALRHLEALQELRKANDRVLRRMRRTQAARAG
jgi:hypothetical protein